jgi:hypothetical protein
MGKNALIAEIMQYALLSEHNHVAEQRAPRPELAGLKLFAQPLIGFAGASGACFAKLKADTAIGNHFLLPGEWNHRFCPSCPRAQWFLLSGRAV